MRGSDPDSKAAKSAASGEMEDAGENVTAMEPMLVRESGGHREALASPAPSR